MKKETQFSLDFGKLEDQLILYDEDQINYHRKNRITMRNGIYYIGNGYSDKVVGFNSFGDVLTVFHNPETNPPPVLLPTVEDGGIETTRRVHDYPFRDVGEIALGKSGNLYVDDAVPPNRMEFDSELKTGLNRIVLQFDGDGRFVDYLGQEGSGGTPFPFITSLRTSMEGEIVVFTRTSLGWKVFWFSIEGTPLYIVELLNDQLPIPDDIHLDEGLTLSDVVVVPDTLDCAPDFRRIYFKIDYYTNSHASVRDNGYVGSHVWWLDVEQGNYTGNIMLPLERREPEPNGVAQEPVLGYELIGIARGGNIFLTSLIRKNEFKLLIMNSNGLVVGNSGINFGEQRLLEHTSYVTDSGILCALLGWERKVEVALWRCDKLLPKEIL